MTEFVLSVGVRSSAATGCCGSRDYATRSVPLAASLDRDLLGDR